MASSQRAARRLLATLAFGIVSSTCYAPAAHAAWLQASSDHFVIYTDDSERAAREFAERLEKYDSALRRVFPVATEDAGRASNRLTVYVVSHAGVVQRLMGPGSRDVLGFYRPRVSGSVAFTPKRTGDNANAAGMSAQTVLLHEYAHHFMHSNFQAAYPMWFAEGFAELCSTTRFEKDGSLSFGLPAQARANSLFQRTDITLQNVLDARPTSNNRELTDMVYARGWLLTHLLNFDPARRGQLRAYLKAVNSGKSNLDAATEVFGDLSKLDDELDRYMKSRLQYVPMAPDKLKMGEIRVRMLGAGEIAMMPVNVRSTAGVDDKTAPVLVPEARRIAANYTSDAAVQAQLAEVEFDAGNLAEADAALDRALTIEPKLFDALTYKGLLFMRRAAEAKSDAAQWRAARSWLIKANSVDPDAALPLMLFYDTFTGEGTKPTANAVAALNRALELAPEARELRIRAVVQALEDDKLDFARETLGPLAYDPHVDSAFGKRATVALSHIDSHDAAAALQVLRGAVAEEEPSAVRRYSPTARR